MDKPGLIFTTARILDTKQISAEQYDRFYRLEHIPDVIDFYKRADFPLLALSYMNTNPERDRNYLGVYAVPDVEKAYSLLQKIFFNRAMQSEILGGNIFEYLAAELIPYEKIQTFEGYGHAKKDGTERGQTLVCVAMEPGPSEEQERDFEDWYRKQHLDMLSMCKGYRRTTRYKRLDNEKPRYLALHEYDCMPDELPSDQIAQVSATEWTQKILGEAETYDRDVFKLKKATGNVEEKL